jgi:hypothetical protein
MNLIFYFRQVHFRKIAPWYVMGQSSRKCFRVVGNRLANFLQGWQPSENCNRDLEDDVGNPLSKLLEGIGNFCNNTYFVKGLQISSYRLPEGNGYPLEQLAEGTG